MVPGFGWVLAGGLLTGIGGGAAVGTVAVSLLGALAVMDLWEHGATLGAEWLALCMKMSEQRAHPYAVRPRSGLV